MAKIADIYFKTLNQKGRVFITDKSFLDDFIESCRNKNIPVRTYKRKGFFEVVKD